ncbi:regulator of nonsense transcripts 2 [Lutzomyia longipalpis]|uniref:regulator of nonsense transcripts 2 n=1 Tax=Lutzomyia longipalpis TaxID=7200 RepID=UPI002484125B|nr:regulator of nonsense transcripts 2 [Lutzomyia longipalpis]
MVVEKEEKVENSEVPETETSEDAQEIEDVKNYIAEVQSRIAAKTSLRAENTANAKPTEEYFFKLDSNVKKNTAFVKKLKQFTAAQLDSLLKDMSGLNLTKYISEICAAIVDAKLKTTDVTAMVMLCSKLHQLYQDFSQLFFEHWQKILSIKGTDKLANPSKMRVDLRLFAELVSVGIFSNKSGLALLGNVLVSLIQQDREEFANLSIILSFCKNCGEEYAGLVSKRMSDLAEKHKMTLPSSTFLLPDKQQNLRNLLRDYYTSLAVHLKERHKELQAMERSCQNALSSKGEVSSARREKLEFMQSSFDKLLSSTQTLSDLLREPLPDLPKQTEEASGGIIFECTDPSADGQLDPWGDDETKSFYIDLPDLRLFLPNFAPKQPSVAPEEPQMTEEVLDMDIEPEQLAVEEPLDTEIPAPSTPEPPAEEIIPKAPIPQTIQSTKHQFDTFTHNLMNCVNKELIDSAAIEFLLHLNTKSNRKKLAKVLFGVQRTRLDLLPMFARFVATINIVSPDVATDLALLLKNDFRYHVVKKDQINIESKIKVVRFIGELTKFGLYSKIEALYCLKFLLHDFQHHNIEMACAFLEVCGLYLYNCAESRLRTNVYLEQMMRLKVVTALDSRHAAQIESVYYLVKPPEGVGIVRKQRPPMQMYIRYLVFEVLNKSNVDKIIKLMRRLNWEDKEISDYAIRCLSKAYNIRYHLIRCLADLVSGLSSYQDKAMAKVIDCVFEDIRAGLEIHSPKLAQRRIAMAKYLGELYNYRLIDSHNVLNTLYSIISLGVSMDHAVVSIVDPPGSLFRLKLACVLLDTCGQYFTNSSRKGLDYFLMFFQQYFWFKKSDPIFETDTNGDLFPILVEHMYRDCLASVRPKLKPFTSYDQAKEAVEKLKGELYPTLNSSATDTIESAESELEVINEADSDIENTAEETSEAIADSDEDTGRRSREEVEDLDADQEDSAQMDEMEQQSRKTPEKTQEDLEFEQAFERMSVDSYQERLRDPVKPSTKDIPVPMMTRTGKKTYEQLSMQQSPDQQPKEETVSFVLMMRGNKAGKQQFKTFAAPADSHLAKNLKLQEQKIREENEKVKRLTLNITERIEEEDYQESLLQSQRCAAQNRQQKAAKPQKFKHQKGAPDADLIFS